MTLNHSRFSYPQNSCSAPRVLKHNAECFVADLIRLLARAQDDFKSLKNLL